MKFELSYTFTIETQNNHRTIPQATTLVVCAEYRFVT